MKFKMSHKKETEHSDKLDRRPKEKEVEEDIEVENDDAKDDTVCVHEGCKEPRAPGQTYVCTKHIRTN